MIQWQLEIKLKVMCLRLKTRRKIDMAASFCSTNQEYESSDAIKPRINAIQCVLFLSVESIDKGVGSVALRCQAPVFGL